MQLCTYAYRCGIGLFYSYTWGLNLSTRVFTAPLFSVSGGVFYVNSVVIAAGDSLQIKNTNSLRGCVFKSVWLRGAVAERGCG